MTRYVVHCKECGDIVSSTIKGRAEKKREKHIQETGHPTWINKANDQKQTEPSNMTNLTQTGR